MVKKLFLSFNINLLLVLIDGKKGFGEGMRTSRTSHLLRRRIILNFISVDICTGNFSFAETCATFSSEVVEGYLCFCGARFNHWIMSSLAVMCDFPKPHI